MSIMHLVWYVIVGFVVGLIARAILPGADHFGFIGTTIIGIVGSLVGGFVGSLVSKPPEGATFHRAGFFMSVAGAIVLLLALRALG